MKTVGVEDCAQPLLCLEEEPIPVKELPVLSNFVCTWDWDHIACGLVPFIMYPHTSLSALRIGYTSCERGFAMLLNFAWLWMRLLRAYNRRHWSTREAMQVSRDSHSKTWLIVWDLTSIKPKGIITVARVMGIGWASYEFAICSPRQRVKWNSQITQGSILK